MNNKQANWNRIEIQNYICLLGIKDDSNFKRINWIQFDIYKHHFLIREITVLTKNVFYVILKQRINEFNIEWNTSTISYTEWNPWEQNNIYN